jgi:protease-4
MFNLLSTATRRSRLAGIAASILLSAIALADAPKLGFLEIEGKPLTKPPAFAWLLGESKEHTLREYVDSIESVSDDDDLKGLVIRLKDAELTAADVDELGAAMKHLRDKGKKVHVFAEGYGSTELLLGSHADEVIAQSGAPVELPGLHMEEMFLADTLAWIGVKANMVQVGDYKGASEQMGRNSPSPQWEQNISQLLDSMYANLRGSLKDGRRLDDAGLDKAMENAWMCDAAQAKSLRLIDSEVDLATIGDHLSKIYGGEVEWDYDLFATGDAELKPQMSNPLAMLQMLAKKPDHTPTKATIALINIDGVIVDGDSGGGGLLGGEGNVGSRTIRNAMEEILKEDLVKGVVVRIGSPGGSATASEVIWQGLRRLAAKKPVWISVGDMAASGGYYIAVGGDKIYVNPSSIVGSIGVVGGRYSMQGLYDTLKVRVFPRSRGPKAEMFRSTTEWTPAELALVRTKMSETYSLFTKRVSAGRKGIDLSKTAEGRLFTGDKAIKLGMADKIGGLDQCIEDLAASLNLDDYDIMDYPGPKSIEETVGDLLGSFAAATGHSGSPDRHAGAAIPAELLATLRAAVGPKAWPQVRAELSGMMQLRDQPVVLMSPSVLIFK